MDPVAVCLQHFDHAWAHRWESLSGALEGVTAEEADWQAPCYAKEEREEGWPAPGTVRWQVAHLAHCHRHYADCLRRRLEPKAPAPPVRVPTRSYAEERAGLESARADLRAAIAGCEGTDPEHRLFGGTTVGDFLAAVVRHDAWHGGQIAVARRLWRTRDGASAAAAAPAPPAP